jgi:hypothetical protein
MPVARSRIFTPLALCACLFLTACGDSVRGTYQAEGGMPMTMEFKSGGKVIMAGMGEKTEGTYKVDGDKVVVTIDNQPATFVKQKDGTLVSQDGMLAVTLRKKK